MDSEAFGAFMRIVNTPFNRGLHGLCQEPAIRAHSIQNSRVLGLIAADGHVATPIMTAAIDTGPRIDRHPPVARRRVRLAGESYGCGATPVPLQCYGPRRSLGDAGGVQWSKTERY